MNFIFDIGNVLVDYKPVVYLDNLFSDSSLVKKMHETIFKSPEWLLMDQGALSHAEAINIFCARTPELKNAILQTMERVNNIFTPIPETIKLLPKIKESGHNLYYLSNIHFEIRDYLLENHEYFSLFDGGVFSCDVRLTKPSPEIYRHLLKKYQLHPEECLFFDDMRENVSAAEKEGVKAVLFTTAECVLPFL